MSKCTSTQDKPFSLVYGAETYRGVVPSAGLALTSKLANSHDHISNVKALKEKRHNVENR